MPDDFCSACGRRARDVDRFCRGCGEPLDDLARSGEPMLLAEGLASRGQLDEAIATLQRAIGAAESPELHAALSTLYLRRGGVKEARRALLRALALDPRCAVAHAYVGGLLIHEGRVAEAQQELDLAHELAPDDIVVAIKRAEYWFRLGIFENARTELRRGLQNGGGSPQARAMAETMYAAVEKRSRGSFTRKTVALPSVGGLKRMLRRQPDANVNQDAEVSTWP